MYVSAYIHPRWFESEGDRDLYYLKQIGIDHVDASLNLIEDYRKTGIFEQSSLDQLVDRLDKAGLKIERVTTRGRVIRREPDWELNQAEELDKVCKVTEMVLSLIHI